MRVSVRYGYDHQLLLAHGEKVWADDLGTFLTGK
jgi:hypothetical protein